MWGKLERCGKQWRLTTFRLTPEGVEPIATTTGSFEFLSAAASYRSAFEALAPQRTATASRRRSRSGTFALRRAKLIYPEFNSGIHAKIGPELDAANAILGGTPETRKVHSEPTSGVLRVGPVVELDRPAGERR